MTEKLKKKIDRFLVDLENDYQKIWNKRFDLLDMDAKVTYYIARRFYHRPLHIQDIDEEFDNDCFHVKRQVDKRDATNRAVCHWNSKNKQDDAILLEYLFNNPPDTKEKSIRIILKWMTENEIVDLMKKNRLMGRIKYNHLGYSWMKNANVSNNIFFIEIDYARARQEKRKEINEIYYNDVANLIASYIS